MRAVAGLFSCLIWIRDHAIPTIGTILARSHWILAETRQELIMPIILWLMGVPLVVVVLLMLTHVI